MPYKCSISPDQASYTMKDGVEVVSSKLDGGASRFRRDILNSTRGVTATWTVSRFEYEYLRSFYKVAVNQASTPFLIDLILDKHSLTEHDAYFVPDSMQLIRQEGHRYTVSALLEVVPLPEDFIYDSTFIALWEEYGSDWETDVDIFDYSVNVEWPPAVGA